MLTCVITLGVNGNTPPGHPDATYQDFSRGIARIRDGLSRTGYQGEISGLGPALP